MGLKTNCFQTPLENIYGKIKLKDIPISISKLYHIWVWLFAQSQQTMTAASYGLIQQSKDYPKYIQHEQNQTRFFSG